MKVLLVCPRPMNALTGNLALGSDPYSLEHFYTICCDLGVDVAIYDGYTEIASFSHTLKKEHPDLVLLTEIVPQRSVLRRYFTDVKRWNADCLTVLNAEEEERPRRRFAFSALDYILSEDVADTWRAFLQALLANMDPTELPGIVLPLRED